MQQELIIAVITFTGICVFFAVLIIERFLLPGVEDDVKYPLEDIEEEPI